MTKDNHAHMKATPDDEAALDNVPSRVSLDIPVKDQKSERSRIVDDVIDAVYSESWSRNLFLLALTAGPLTYLGLQAGYLVGYGRLASFELFIYFAVFTFVAGVGGIAFRIYETISTRNEQKRATNALNTTLEIMPDLIKLVQNLRLMHEDDPQMRDIDAGVLVLKNTHAAMSSLEEAVYRMTGNPILSDAIRRIEVYRRYGLSVSVKQIIGEIAQESHRSVEEIREISPTAASWLEMRLGGRAPTIKGGLPRSEGFLERLLSWMGSDNDDLLRQRDIEEFFVLAYELLCGREIPILSIDFKSRADLGQLSYNLSIARNNYRIGNAARFSRLRAIVRVLNAIEAPDLHLSIPAKESDANTLLAHVHGGINALCDVINQRINAADKTQKTHTKELVSELEIVLGLYLELIKANQRAQRLKRELEKALNAWHKALSKYEGERLIFRGVGAKSGLTINEHNIRLRDHEKVQFSGKIANALQAFYKQYNAVVFSTSFSLGKAYLDDCMDDLKKLVVEIFDALDDHVYLTQADRQRAIEHSHATNFSSLEMGFSARGKLVQATSLTRDVENDMGRTAERLFRAMIAQYGVDADEKTINTLHQKYGARRAVMRDMADAIEPGAQLPELTPPEDLDSKTILQPSWQQILTRGRQFIADISIAP